MLLIDETLRSLGWPPDSFHPEDSAGRAGYLDYLLSTGGVPRLIVEAKKFGHAFGIPRTNLQKNHYQLRALRSSYGQALTDVLEQARGYSLETRVPFAILTNGGEWILAQLSPAPGFNSLDEMRVIYFGNILTDNFRFGLFWDLLSRTQVEEGELESYFAQLNAKEADFCRSPQARYGVLKWGKQSDSKHIREFYDRFFDEIIDSRRRAMLTLCFVSNSELDHYQGELQRTLRDTAPSIVGDAIEISPEERSRLLGGETGDKKGRVVLVTGSVGCGKTTLVHKVLIEAKQDQSLMPVVIDLINEAASENSSVADRLWGYIAQKWRDIDPDSDSYEQLAKIFHREISSLKTGPSANLFSMDPSEFTRQEAALLSELRREPSKFLPSCWRYHQSKRKGIVVVLDNVDRASQRYQEQVYAFAHLLADETGATVIVTMREFTFFRGQEAGFLDVRSSDLVFHLKSPNIMMVLAKRIKYIENHLDQDYRVSEWRRLGDWESFRTSALMHAQIVKATFLLSKDGQERLSIVEAIAWHNVRYLLQVLRQIHLSLGGDPRPWEVSEMIASLMTPSIHGRPIIGNVYRPSYPLFKCYFLKLRLLLVLIYGQQEYETRRGTGFERLLTLMSLYGYHNYWTKKAIVELVRERYLECLEAPAEEEYTKDYTVLNQHSFRPSPLAVVLVEQIAAQPLYLCLIGNDLPFHTERAFQLYESALSDVYRAIGSQELVRDAVDLLPDTLVNIVAKYLIEMYEAEKPSDNLLNHVPEIGGAEDQLRQLVKKLSICADISIPTVQHYVGAATQPSLFREIESVVRRTERTTIPIPDNIRSLSVGRSEQGPLIFWALVQLKREGVDFASGVEITRVINEHLVGDHNKKAPNNISRALRSRSLCDQPWLRTKRISDRKKVFGLRDGWEKHWQSLFQSSPPLLNFG
jgi:hypothetical protein